MLWGAELWKHKQRQNKILDYILQSYLKKIQAKNKLWFSILVSLLQLVSFCVRGLSKAKFLINLLEIIKI